MIVGPIGLRGAVVLVDLDERDEAATDRGRAVLAEMPLERRSGGGKAGRAGREEYAAAAAPAKPIVPFVVAGPIGPSLHRCPQFRAV